MTLDIISGDRRRYRRFACQMDLRFEQDGRCLGEGVTADLSRRALCFRTEPAPRPGTALVVRLAWPFLLQGVCPLELVLKGKVATVAARGTILTIRSYEFRTCGERSFAEPPSTSGNARVA
ncbi:MAG TPA: PilZ domain-containing protein [Bryobacteraceae bacterium]|nr:PilZ domain-containing protein [Bryobacteraceae bacterium]